MQKTDSISIGPIILQYQYIADVLIFEKAEMPSCLTGYSIAVRVYIHIRIYMSAIRAR